MDILKKKFGSFLKEATEIKTKTERNAYWNDDNLFAGGDVWIDRIRSGEIKLDDSPFGK